MKLNLSLNNLKDDFTGVLRRFPVASAMIFLYTAYGICVVWDAPTSREFDIAANISLSLGILFSTAAYLWCSCLRASAKTSAICQAAGVVLSAANFCALLMRAQYLGYADAIGYATAYTALATAIFFLPPVGSPSIARQWQYSTGVLGGVCFGVVLAIILGIFSGIVFGTLNILFGIGTYRIVSTATILLSGTVASLAGLYRLPDGSEALHPEGVGAFGLSVFTKNVLLPLAAIYTVILYAYGLKILFTFELPKGSVCLMVTGLVSAVLTIIYGLQGYLCESSDTQRGRRIAQLAVRKLPTAMIPLLVLMSVAIFYRINEYGVTPKRLYVATFNIWAYAVAFYLTFKREPKLNIVAFSFAVIFLLTSAIPGFNYSTWGLNAVRKKIVSELAEAGFDKLPIEYDELKTALGTMPKAQAESLAEELSRLDEWDNHSAVADIVKSDRTLYRWELLSNVECVEEPHEFIVSGRVGDDEFSPIPAGYTSVKRLELQTSMNLASDSAGIVEIALNKEQDYRIPVDSLVALDPSAPFQGAFAEISGEPQAVLYITKYSIRGDSSQTKPYRNILVCGYLFRKQPTNNDILQ